MEQFTKEHLEQAQKLSDFYIELIENHPSTLRYYLADNVVLDWFDKSIKKEKKVSAFVRDTVCKITHHMTRTFPTESVAFKDIHYVKLLREELSPVISPPSPNPVTPPRQTQPSTSMLEIGQGDGFHNNGNMMSPPKKQKLTQEKDSETVEGESDFTKIKYVTSEGAVEFHRQSVKKLQTETKWRRPCKLHLGYTGSSPKDCTIHLIIYEGNVKCRRNLMKEFCKTEDD